MYSSLFVRSASLLLSVPREIKENDNGDDDDEKKTAAAGVVKAYSSKTNSQWKRIYAHTYIDEHWVADCPSTLEIAATFLLLNTDTNDACVYHCYHYSFSFFLILYLTTK